MKNKKSIMAFSALAILIFHLWINMSMSNQVELFLRQTAYVGVDIFFFISGFSLAGREIENYWKFELSRFKAIYVKFIIFALISFFVAKWEIKRLLLVICGAELFTKGGGSFLWFLPAIMLFYLFYPLFAKGDKKNRWVTLVVTLVIWFAIGFAVTKLTSYNAMFIFYNRIPVFLLGHYVAKWDKFEKLMEKKWITFITGLLLTALGTVLVYNFAYKGKLMVPLTDMFYVVVIPAALGIILLVSFIPELKVIKWIGSSTLEMYGIQMVFGYTVAGKLLMSTKNKGLANLGSILFVIVTAIIVQYIYSLIKKGIDDKFSKKKKEKEEVKNG